MLLQRAKYWVNYFNTTSPRWIYSIYPKLWWKRNPVIGSYFTEVNIVSCCRKSQWIFKNHFSLMDAEYTFSLGIELKFFLYLHAFIRLNGKSHALLCIWFSVHQWTYACLDTHILWWISLILNPVGLISLLGWFLPWVLSHRTTWKRIFHSYRSSWTLSINHDSTIEKAGKNKKNILM